MADFSRRNGVIEEATKCGLIEEIRQRPNQRREELARSLNLPLATLHRLVNGLLSLNQINIINGKIKLKSPMYTTTNNNVWSNTQQLTPPAPPYTMMQHIPIPGGGGAGAPPPYPVYPPFISMPPYHHIHNTAIYTTLPSKVRDQVGQPDIRGRQGNQYMVGNLYQPPHGGPPLPPPQQQQQQHYNYNYPMPFSGPVARLSNDGTSSHPSYNNNNNNNNNNNRQQHGHMYPSVTYSSTPGTGGETTQDCSGRGEYSTDNNNNNNDDDDDVRLSQGRSNNNKDSTPCAFFLKTGTCAWGENCRFAHPYHLAPEPKFNSMGLPVRQDQPDCVFYMRTGRCSFGFTCKYNHPDSSGPVVVVEVGGGGAYNNNNNVSVPLYGYGGSVRAIGGGGGSYQYGIGAPPNGGLPRMAPPPRRKQPVVFDNNSTIGAAVVVEVSGEGGGEEVKEANNDGSTGVIKKDDDSREGGVERETEQGGNQHGVFPWL